jgi:hypothetical protein
MAEVPSAASGRKSVQVPYSFLVAQSTPSLGSQLLNSPTSASACTRHPMGLRSTVRSSDRGDIANSGMTSRTPCVSDSAILEADRSTHTVCMMMQRKAHKVFRIIINFILAIKTRDFGNVWRVMGGGGMIDAISK